MSICRAYGISSALLYPSTCIIRVQHAHCAGCRLVLGLRINTIRAVDKQRRSRSRSGSRRRHQQQQGEEEEEQGHAQHQQQRRRQHQLQLASSPSLRPGSGGSGGSSRRGSVDGGGRGSRPQSRRISGSSSNDDQNDERCDPAASGSDGDGYDYVSGSDDGGGGLGFPRLAAPDIRRGTLRRGVWELEISEQGLPLMCTRLIELVGPTAAPAPRVVTAAAAEAAAAGAVAAAVAAAAAAAAADDDDDAAAAGGASAAAGGIRQYRCSGVRGSSGANSGGAGGASTSAAAGVAAGGAAAGGSSGAGSGCGTLLFEAPDVLSRQHAWDVGTGQERAYFVNKLMPGSFLVGPARAEPLAQGLMEVADVFCSRCGGALGWKFCKDLTPGMMNEAQVGRFGVVESSFRARGCREWRMDGMLALLSHLYGSHNGGSSGDGSGGGSSDDGGSSNSSSDDDSGSSGAGEGDGGGDDHSVETDESD